MKFASDYHKREADSKKTVPYFYTHRDMRHLTHEDRRVSIREAPD